MRTFVVPDLHGRYALAHGLLMEADLIDWNGLRIPGRDARVVQLGDLANCVLSDREADLRLLRRARDWFDVCLVGNHEYPYLGAPTAFMGFARIREVEQAVLAVPWRVALAVGGTLLTHAGVAADVGDLPGTAREVEETLERAWRLDAADPLFSAVGRARGGRRPAGGVLWSDWSEPRDRRFSQVHGHTPMSDGPDVEESDRGTFAVNLDCGGHGEVDRIVGLWLDEDGERDGFVEYQRLATAARRG